MTLRIDHFFVLCEPGAPEAEQLVEAGFLEGAPNVHPGQGTANRRFFFDDTGLELLYVSDRDEALSGPGRNMCVVQRSESAKASPFGIVVDAGAAEPPFDTWEYWPDYFDGRHFFRVGSNSSRIDEPLCVCMPDGMETLSRPRSDNPGLLLTSLEVALPSTAISPVLEQIGRCERLNLRLGQNHQMLVEFNHGEAGRELDLTPASPLILRW